MPMLGYSCEGERELLMRHGVKMIQRMMLNSDRVSGLTDTQLADALIDKVWVEFAIDEYASALVDEAVSRLRGEKGKR